MVNFGDQLFTPKNDSWRMECKSEEMAGNMILIGRNEIRQRVQVKVYRTSVEHFAVVYPMRKASHPLGILNLKNTIVERLSSQFFGFVLRKCGFDTPLCSLTFLSETGSELDRWIEAFTWRRKTSAGRDFRLSSLPILNEDDEF